MRQADGSWLVSPKQLGIVTGSALGALLLSVISIISTMNINDTDRYTGSQAEADLAIMNERIFSLAQDMSQLQERVEGVRREHNWMKGLDSPSGIP